MGVNENGESETTCVIQWDLGHPIGGKRKKMPPKRHKTSVPLETAIAEVGLPADVEVLRAAFYRAYGGTNSKAANTAWHRAMEASDLVLENGKLGRGEGG